MSSFTIDLATLRPGHNRLQLQEDAAGLELAPDGWSGWISGEFEVERSGEQVAIRGQLRAVAQLDCVRCLRAFEMPIVAPLEIYADRSGAGRHADHEVDLERDDYMKFHDGRHLDVSDSAREALLLELPMAPRCREDCRGLCPRCGAELNEGPCGCGAV
jgi:uncharacterized protein